VVLSGGHLGDLHRRDARTGARTALLRHGDLRITDIAVAIIAQHQVVVTGSPRTGVRLHDLASGQALADYRSPGDDMEWVHSVDVLRMDGRPVIVGAGDGGLVWMWDLLDGECLLRWKVPDGDAHRAVWRGLLVDGTPVLAGVQAEDGPTTGHIALYDLASRTRRDVVIQAFEGYNSSSASPYTSIGAARRVRRLRGHPRDVGGEDRHPHQPRRQRRRHGAPADRARLR
jgi:WD40 repeat protein